jgi:hypothetical protein
MDVRADDANDGRWMTHAELAASRKREKVLEPLAKGIPEAQLVQVALLPAGMHITAEAIRPARLLHWEQIVKEFADVASASYFCGVLDIALKHYEVLRNEKLVFHANMEAQMTGEDILKRYDNGTLEFRAMGRKGGSTGAGLARDLTLGGWRKRRYELRSQETPPAWRNRLAIEDFVARVRQINRPD